MGDFEDKVAVIGKQQQALGVCIQTARRNQSRPRNVHEVGDFSDGVTIRDSGDITDRLVERNIVMPLRGGQRSAVHDDFLPQRVYLRSGRGNNDVVYRDPACRDPVLGLSTGRKSGVGNGFL